MVKMDVKMLGRLVLLGSGVTILTPIVAQVMPPIFDLGIITLGVAVSAGVAAFATEWILQQINLK